MISNCRSCGSSALQTVLDLGAHPGSNALLSPDQLSLPERVYPLRLAFCRDCALLQVMETVPAEELYRRDYPYFSSSSAALLAHSRRHAAAICRTRRLDGRSLVVEVASNDGYLLKNFVEWGIPVLGIDPAQGPAARANETGVATINDFFSAALADELVRQGKRADVMIANNVVAHVDSINDFVSGFKRLLKDDGVAFFEFAYAVDMIAKCEFDTIYHEHLFYHTVTGITPLFERHGLYVNDAVKLPIHGGSLRIEVGHARQPTARLREILSEEDALGVGGAAFYAGFAARVEAHAAALRRLLRELKRGGAGIACYGAAAKGSTMLNYLELGKGFFDFVVDVNPFKHGKLMPGQRVPILHPNALLERMPHYVLLLVWNFAGEVLRAQRPYREAGGRFIVPLPQIRIIEPVDRITSDFTYDQGKDGAALGTVGAA